MNRRQAREMAMKALFQMSVGNTDQKTAIDVLNNADRAVDPFVTRLLNETTAHLKEIDRLIEKHLTHWSFERIGNIDRTILRLAVCELLYFDDVPNAVCMNEAVELCKRYGDEKTRRFVNGVLSGISGEMENK
ncbi:transcription antitermination factor NusB [Sporolactobacillus sp. THM7-7]|nr:transcription antitermination factor NusB [Sporolactobacillus sp. THM7-7]